MNKVNESAAALNQATVETALSFAKVSMETAEKLMRMQLDAAKSFVAEQSETAKSLAQATDPEAMLALRARITERSVEHALGYTRGVYEVAAQSQQQFTALIEQRMAAFQQEMSAAMGNALNSAPPGSETAVAAIKSTMAAAQSAMDSLNKAAKQATEIAESNVRAMTNAAGAGAKSDKRK